MLAQGGKITMTQSAVVLENLIGQFLYNKAADAGAGGGSTSSGSGAAALPAGARYWRQMMVLQRLAAASLAALALAGCATGPNANPADPLEPFNRGVSTFNDNLDTYALKPVAEGYQDYTPSPVRPRSATSSRTSATSTRRRTTCCRASRRARPRTRCAWRSTACSASAA
jgi:hypothetical protein